MVYCTHFDIHYYLNALVLVLVAQLLNEIHSKKIDFILLCMLWLNFVMDIKWSINRVESEMRRRRGRGIATKPFWLTCGGSLLFVKCVCSQAEVSKLLRYCHHVIETWQPKFFAVISWWKSVIHINFCVCVIAWHLFYQEQKFFFPPWQSIAFDIAHVQLSQPNRNISRNAKSCKSQQRFFCFCFSSVVARFSNTTR